jgi:hypothetical protein
MKRTLAAASVLFAAVLCGVAYGETTFTSADHRVLCEMGSNWVLCTSPRLARMHASMIDGEVCDKSAWDEETTSGEALGPAAIELAAHGRPSIIGRCVINTEEIGVLWPRYRIRNGTETCHGRTSSSIICQSHSGHFFIVSSTSYHRR